MTLRAQFYTPEFVRRAVFRRYSNGAIWVGFATIGGALAGLLVIPDEPSGNSKPMATWLTVRLGGLGEGGGVAWRRLGCRPRAECGLPGCVDARLCVPFCESVCGVRNVLLG